MNIGKNRVIQEFTNWGELFKIEFDITVNKLGSGWTNILHFTKGGKISNTKIDEVGNRIPGIWMHSDSYFYFENDFCTFNNGCGKTKTFALNTKYKITIQQYMDADTTTYWFQIIIDDQELLKKPFPKVNLLQNFPNVKVYASDPWGPSFAGKGSICNLKIDEKHITQLSGCIEEDKDLSGNDLPGNPRENVDLKDCHTLCLNNNQCHFWTYGFDHTEHYRRCWLKSSDSGRTEFKGLISGPKICGELSLCSVVI